MIKFTINNVEHKIFFRYIQKNDKSRRSTVCVIAEKGELNKFDKVCSTGQAICDTRDRFVKELGRRKSLAKAVRSSEVLNQHKKLVWEAYEMRKK